MSENKKKTKVMVEIEELTVNEYELEKAIKTAVKDNLSFTFTVGVYFKEEEE